MRESDSLQEKVEDFSLSIRELNKDDCRLLEGRGLQRNLVPESPARPSPHSILKSRRSHFDFVSLLKSLKETLSHCVIRVLSDVDVFADTVGELFLLLIGKLISGKGGSLLPELGTALVEGVSHHKTCLRGLHVEVVHFF